MADFGRPFGPTACQESPEVGRCARFRRHGVELRHVDATHPAIDAPAADTQFAGDLRDSTAGVVERSDLIEHRLAGGVASAAHQTFVFATSEHRSELPIAVAPTCPDHPRPGQRILGSAPRSGRAAARWSPASSSAGGSDQRPAAPAARPHARLRIKASTIPADNLDFRMRLEPVRHGSGRAIRQQIHHLTTLQIDDDRPESSCPSAKPIHRRPATRTTARLVWVAALFLTLRRIVVSLIGMPSLAISRSEGRPPALWPNSLTIPAKRVVRRANGAASCGSRSAKIRRSQRWFLHRQRVDRAWIITGFP